MPALQRYDKPRIAPPHLPLAPTLHKLTVLCLRPGTQSPSPHHGALKYSAPTELIIAPRSARSGSSAHSTLPLLALAHGFPRRGSHALRHVTQHAHQHLNVCIEGGAVGAVPVG